MIRNRVIVKTALRYVVIFIAAAIIFLTMLINK